MDGLAFVMMLIFILFSAAFIVYISKVYQKGEDNEEKVTKRPLNFLDKGGVWLETTLSRGFTYWGEFCASYPIPVVVVSLTVACLLCAGINSLIITTDPVELWSGPNSR